MQNKTVILMITVSLGVLLISIIFMFLNAEELLSIFLPSKIDRNPLVVLFVGIDEKIENTVRTDAIVIGIVDHAKKQIVLTNVPRDLLIGNSKINSVYQKSGIQGLSSLLSKMLEINVERYVIVDYEVFKYLGDRLGPIEITIKEPMHYEDTGQKLSIHFEPGIYKMKGEQLLAYIRYRKDAMGDVARIERQREVLSKLASKVVEMDLHTLLQMASEVLGKIKTDLKLGEILYLGLRFRKNLYMSFVNFPYTVTDKGDIVFDQSKLKTFKDQITKERPKQEKENFPSLLILNSTTDKSRDFLVRTLNLWNSSVGSSPLFVIWEDIGVNYKNDMVLIMNSSKKTLILETVKKAYPTRIFEIKDFSFDLLKEYLMLVDKASKNRIYLKGIIDAVVVISK